jgi:hypothetical protein
VRGHFPDSPGQSRPADWYFPCKAIQYASFAMPDPRRSTPDQSTRSSSAKPGWSKEIKAYYDSIVQEPVPDDMQGLMASLARTIRS